VPHDVRTLFCYPTPTMDKGISWVKKYWALSIILVVILVFLGAYLAGFRLGAGGIVRVGSAEIRGIPEGSKIYVDEARLVTAKKDVTQVYLKPGAHSVIVDVEEMQPWNEVFTVEEGKATVLHPIAVRKSVLRETVEPGEHASARGTLSQHPIPTAEKPLLLQDGCVSTYVSQGRIIASATTTPGCTPPPYLACLPQEGAACPPTLIFAPTGTIRSVVKYPGREDALVVASGTLSYVVELDPREPQFFSPVLRNGNIRIAPLTDGVLLIEEAGAYYRITL